MKLLDLICEPYAQMLDALAGQLRKADAHAQAKGFDFGVLLGSQLAPDMFPLTAQIRFVCIQAAEAIARVTGQAKVDTPEVESLDGALSLLATTASRLRAAERLEELDEDSAVELELGRDIVFDMDLREYVRSWSLPQFYFHLNTAYAIMRHNGVDLGKADYVPHAARFVRK